MLRDLPGCDQSLFLEFEPLKWVAPEWMGDVSLASGSRDLVLILLDMDTNSNWGNGYLESLCMYGNPFSLDEQFAIAYMYICVYIVLGIP